MSTRNSPSIPDRNQPAASSSSPVPPNYQQQEELYTQAMRFYRSGQLREAIPLFEQVALGPSAQLAHAARTHKAACERRLAQVEVQLETLEDRYTYAVALMNARRLDEALEQLQQVLVHDENCDHVHYALAICYGLKGEFEKAAEHLKKAIELRPENRVKARHDPDFESIAEHPQLRQLLSI